MDKQKQEARIEREEIQKARICAALGNERIEPQLRHPADWRGHSKILLDTEDGHRFLITIIEVG